MSRGRRGFQRSDGQRVGHQQWCRMKKAIESVRRGAQQPEGLARLTDCDDDRMLPPQRDRHGPEGARSKEAAPRVSHATCVWPGLSSSTEHELERPMSTVTRSMGMSTSDQVVSRPPRRRTPIHDAGRRGSQSSSMTSTAPKALSVMVWHLGDSHCGSCEVAPATTNHR